MANTESTGKSTPWLVIVLLILLPFPFWANLLIVLGIPTAAYLALDPSQRRRLRRTGRKELGR